jgi:hypothetical protein
LDRRPTRACDLLGRTLGHRLDHGGSAGSLCPGCNHARPGPPRDGPGCRGRRRRLVGRHRYSWAGVPQSRDRLAIQHSRSPLPGCASSDMRIDSEVIPGRIGLIRLRVSGIVGPLVGGRSTENLGDTSTFPLGQGASTSGLAPKWCFTVRVRLFRARRTGLGRRVSRIDLDGVGIAPKRGLLDSPARPLQSWRSG